MPLHPVFGPGEDRNASSDLDKVIADALHPVFGPGEDRNNQMRRAWREGLEAAPGLRTG